MSNITEGTGHDPSSSSSLNQLPKEIIAFLEWGELINIKNRFDKFCDEFHQEFIDSLNENNEEEYSLKSYEIFQKYESFFSLELKEFLEESKFDEIDFTNSCLNIKKRQYDNENNMLLQLALSSLNFRNFREMIIKYNENVEMAKEAAEDMGI